MVGTRVAPDNSDVIVWKFDDNNAPFVNSSTSPSAPSHAVSDLASISGTILLQQPSPFAASGSNSCVVFIGNNSASPRNTIFGANNAEVQPPITISCWLYLRTYNSTGFTQHYWSKQHTTGVWSGTFAQVGAQNRQYTSQPTAFDFFMVTTTGADPILDANNNVPIGTWCHVGMTFDGTTKTVYVNGNIMQTTAATGSINYGNHGPWFFGAIPAGSGNPEEGQFAICDFRVANVARPQSYFQDIYKKGITTASSGQPFTTYYKLRAFDTACSTPTASYWVSTKPTFADAPSAPCGSYGPLEIVESWAVIGFPTPPAPTVQSTLNGLSWLLPNTGNINNVSCFCPSTYSTSATLPGSPATLYTVTLRFRGVVEQKTYTGGANDGAYFQVGGAPAVDTYNVYRLDISSPAQTYYLNRGTSGQTVVYGIDYTKVIQMNGGAIVTLSADAIDGQEIRNDGANTPISIAGISDPSQPYNGQFLQMGVISVV